jgi:peroxiredoxin Q/BCP
MRTLLLLLPLVMPGLPTRPAPGDPAPGFALPASDGTTVSLADFNGKKMVVLAFFPKAFTPG